MKLVDHARGVTDIFFWGGKVIFPDFFPGVKCFFLIENSHFGTPKTNFCCLQKWKAKKKKKKGPHLLFILPFPIFHLLFYNFPSFFSIFTSFSLFSWYVSKNFPVRSLWGALCPHLLCHSIMLLCLDCKFILCLAYVCVCVQQLFLWCFLFSYLRHSGGCISTSCTLLT